MNAKKISFINKIKENSIQRWFKNQYPVKKKTAKNSRKIDRAKADRIIQEKKSEYGVLDKSVLGVLALLVSITSFLKFPRNVIIEAIPLYYALSFLGFLPHAFYIYTLNKMSGPKLLGKDKYYIKLFYFQIGHYSSAFIHLSIYFFAFAVLTIHYLSRDLYKKYNIGTQVIDLRKNINTYHQETGTYPVTLIQITSNVSHLRHYYLVHDKKEKTIHYTNTWKYMLSPVKIHFKEKDQNNDL